MESGVELEYPFLLRDHLAWHWYIWSKRGLGVRLAAVAAVGVVVLLGVPAFLTAPRPLSVWAWWMLVAWAMVLAGAGLYISAGVVGEWLNVRQRGGGTLRWRFGPATFSVTVGDESREHSWSDIGAVAETTDHFLVTGEKRVAGIRTLPIPKREIDSGTILQLRVAAQSSKRARVTSSLKRSVRRTLTESDGGG